MDQDTEVCSEEIKPQLIEEDVFDILKMIYGFEGGIITQLNGYDDLNFHYVKPKMLQNPYLTTECPHGYVLKVINSKDSVNTAFRDAVINFMIFLKEHQVTCPRPVKNKYGDYFSVEKLPLVNRGNKKQRRHVVMLLEYLPGTLLKHIQSSFTLYYEIGATAASIVKASKEFHHGGYETYESIWHLNAMQKVKSYTHVMKEGLLKETVEGIMNDFINEVVPKMNPSDKQVIHGDLNSYNLVCEGGDRKWKVSSVIDFGDSHISYPLYELAICMFYTMLDCKEKMLDCFVGSGHTLAGYLISGAGPQIDFPLLKLCIAARLCQSYVLGLYNSSIQPDNVYISENLTLYPQLLSDIIKTPISVVEDVWTNTINSYMNL